MAVDFVHDELNKRLTEYQLIDDCIEGQRAIKARGITYLPKPDPSNNSPENNANYKQYLERAMFLGVLQRTFIGLEGMIFMREPSIKVSGLLNYIIDNADGEGNSLVQVARRVVQYVAPLGRAGLLVDYPRVDGKTSIADVISGTRSPRILAYHPKNVINWRVQNKKLVLVVLKEVLYEYDDEFTPTSSNVYRVLKLENDVYTQQVYVDGGNGITTQDPITPLDGNGKEFREIPFKFIGSTNNDPTVDPAPLSALADISIAHYRNSADYEQSCFVLGQPTLWASGLDQNWVKNVLNNEIRLGCKSFLPLPKDAAAGLIQVAPNTMSKEAMDAKEKQMLALGAKLLDISNGNVEQTRKEVEIKYTAETSQLAQIAINVSSAFVDALNWCGKFLNENSKNIFRLSTDFTSTKLSSDDQRALRENYVAGLITFEEMRNILLSAGLATEENYKKAKAQIEEDQEFFKEDEGEINDRN